MARLRTTLGSIVLLVLVVLLAISCETTPSKLAAPQQASGTERDAPKPAALQQTPGTEGGAPQPAASETSPGACVDAECAYDPGVRACIRGRASAQAAGPVCACAFDGSGCVIEGWQGEVPCREAQECACTRRYKPAPSWLFPRGNNATPERGASPGDCVAMCRQGRCVATQGML